MKIEQKKEAAFDRSAASSQLLSLDESFVMHKYYNGFSSDCQELEKSFFPKRDFTLKVSDAYSRLGSLYRVDFSKEHFIARAKRVFECSTYLDFAHEIFPDGAVSSHGRLYRANFCRDRFCPMCSWRRSLKIYSQVSSVINHLCNDYKFVFLTLTVPNVSGSFLSSTVDRLLASFSRLARLSWFKQSYFGFIRILEVTYNKKSNTYHPHLHIVLAVSPCYFDRNYKYYKTHSDWLSKWREIYSDSRIKFVNIKSFSRDCSFSKSVAEVAKYAVKPTDMLLDDGSIDHHVLETLFYALHSRRLISFTGCFLKASKLLNLSDPEDGDLVHIDDTFSPVVEFLVFRYKWGVGAYRLVSVVHSNDFV